MSGDVTKGQIDVFSYPEHNTVKLTDMGGWVGDFLQVKDDFQLDLPFLDPAAASGGLKRMNLTGRHLFF